MEKYHIEIVNTKAQTLYEGSIKDRLHVMQKLAYKFKSNVRLWGTVPVDDNNGCVDFETEIIHEVKYIERKKYA